MFLPAVYLLFTQISFADSASKDSNDAFLHQVKKYFTLLQNDSSATKLQSSDQIFFLPLELLIPGQDEISVDNILAKFAKLKKNNKIQWNEKEKKWNLAFDAGKSAMPLSDPITVVKGPMGYIIIDGHHEYILSLYLKGKTVPIKVVKDFSKLSAENFWQILSEQSLIYLKGTPRELAKKTPSIAEMKDRPNRYLASLLSAKFISNGGTKQGIKKLNSTNPAPVWIKMDRGVPFIEFHIADIWEKAGIKYKSKWKDKIPAPIVEKARQALLVARDSGEYPILQKIPVIESRKKAEKIVASHEQLEHWLTKEQNCSTAFRKL